MLKRIVNITIWTIIGLYTAIVILLHIPAIQSFIGERVSDALCTKFGTKVSVGRIDLGFFNRLIVDDSNMHDQNGQSMLRVARISVKISPLALASGRIEITSAQFFGLQANLYKSSPKAKPNFQFVIDSLASKDTTQTKTPLNLQINSLIIRNGNIRWRILSHTDHPHCFSPNNIDARNISAHIIVNRITNDSINVKVKRIALDERCGLSLKSLSLHAVAGSYGALLENMKIELPNTLINIPNANATYRKKDGRIEMPTLTFSGSIDMPRITPADFAGFVPQLSQMNRTLNAYIGFDGTGSSVNVRRLHINSADKRIAVEANGDIRRHGQQTEWKAILSKFDMKNEALINIVKAATKKDAPEIIRRLGDVSIDGFAGGSGKNIAIDGNVHTALGTIALAVSKHANNITGNIATRKLNIGKMLADNKLGLMSADINVRGNGMENIAASGRLFDVEYNGYRYRDASLNASYRKKTAEGQISIDDPNIQMVAEGRIDNTAKTPSAKLTAEIRRFEPHALHITGKWPSTNFAANITCDIKGSNIDNAEGTAEISSFCMSNPEKTYTISSVAVKTGFSDGIHFINLNSDFGNIDITGHFNYNTIARSILNMVASKLPTVPGLTRKPLTYRNSFTVNASVNDTEWMKELLGIPLEIHRPLNISGEIDDNTEKIDLWCDVPSFTYNGNRFGDAFVNIESPGDTLKADIRIKKLEQNGKHIALNLKAGAVDNHLNTSLRFSNNERHPLKGVVNASTMFAKNEEGAPTAYIDIKESRATVGDTTWHIMPASITYNKNCLLVDNFTVRHDKQYITINGAATKSHADSLVVALNDIDVSYIMNLVNFHSVEFTGMASGKAYVAGTFSGKPLLTSDLRVDDFRFENGRMGILLAKVEYNDAEGRIEINATAHDGDNRRTDINGYVSPKHNYIDLGIDARHTRAEFMESFCSSFMDNVDVSIDGHVNVVGPLNNINLVGKATASGSLRMSALNTTYWMRNDSITFVPDEIKFNGDTLRDRNGNAGVMTGSIYHKHLTNLSYALNVKAKNLLAYDTHTFGDNTFYGTAYVTGDCSVKGRSGAVTIDVTATPQKNSILVYNAADQRDTGNGDFITWKKQRNDKDSTGYDEDNAAKVDIASDIRLNMHINCTPDATLKLLMDERTGDYITLNGNGVLQANYFNKGTFEMYGNYIVDHGLYKLTVQNIIKKDFVFEKGSSIAFGGDPYNALLDLKAQYVLNSVSLADLNIGRSFSNNNVRVNCLMNITGSPQSPKVDFDLDMPTLGNDVKQMVYSLLNAEEEKNQQVLYLLAVGRFYAQNNNDGSTQQYSQTSLAMQSFLSGTISQQLNDVLSNVINSNKWNFGANISTGTEGFNNAEYEGILSGRLLNNRLLINGQFGYRDNPNATTSFIGDFDIRYLLFPNGNFAINVYNKTNDRYFTRNSLNTQGLGLIMKKDFTKMSDLFFWRKRKKGQ